jgi:hypothetical protein
VSVITLILSAGARFAAMTAMPVRQGVTEGGLVWL